MADLTVVKGIGPKSLVLLSKLNLTTIEDLITFYPFRYNYIKRSSLDADTVIIDGLVSNVPVAYRIKSNLNKMSFVINIDDRLINVIIYNRSFLKNHLSLNKGITIIGKYDEVKNTIVASDIKLYKIGNKVIIEPVYHTTSGLSNKGINNYINSALNIYKEEIADNIPNYLNVKYNFINKHDAINEIHNPSNESFLNKAIAKLKYEELFLFMLKINYLKIKKNKEEGIYKQIDLDAINKLINNLPFKLTNDQNMTLNDILNDFKSLKRMNRIIQGDVGSGKTIVAFLAVYANYLSGYQSALMVPTEVLAQQHYENASKLFKGIINVEIITGSSTKKKKEEITKKLQDNEIDFIIGTHALIVENIKFSNLGFIITDEQHRFGVNQRAILKNKGTFPDVLYLSATPIPRTYALTIYGDLDISTIKTKPIGRKEIKTYIKNSQQLEFISELMLQELKKHHQVFIIAPLIEESENSNLVDINKLYERINSVFGKHYKVELLHGKMKEAEKRQTIEGFKNNVIKILISTTIVEVGVDIPNATVMVIFDAHQFGLATLHQLRGRVGRNNYESYCILVSNYDKERLNVMTKTNDGFVISEEDFKLRGHGDLFGIRQSGDMVFKLADFKNDYELLIKAKKDVSEYLVDNINSELVIKTVKQLETLD